MLYLRFHLNVLCVEICFQCHQIVDPNMKFIFLSYIPVLSLCVHLVSCFFSPYFCLLTLCSICVLYCGPQLHTFITFCMNFNVQCLHTVYADTSISVSICSRKILKYVSTSLSLFPHRNVRKSNNFYQRFQQKNYEEIWNKIEIKFG